MKNQIFIKSGESYRKWNLFYKRLFRGCTQVWPYLLYRKLLRIFYIINAPQEEESPPRFATAERCRGVKR